MLMDTMGWVRLLVLDTLLSRLLMLNVLHTDLRPKLLVLGTPLPRLPVLDTLRPKLLVPMAKLVELALLRRTALSQTTRCLTAALAESLS